MIQGQVSKNCTVCDKTFSVQNWRKNIAKYCSTECKNKSQIGRLVSKEERQKISEKMSGENHWNYGKIASPELLKKLSDSHKGQIVWNKGKPNPQQSGTASNFYKHGLSKNKEYRSWQKNQWHSRLKEAKLLGTHTFDEWVSLKEEHKFACVFCKKTEPEIKITIDHIIPISRGGSDSIENIQPLCMSCNCRKHSRIK